jgi:PhnB protein
MKTLKPHLSGEQNMTVKVIPEGYHSVTPYLSIKDAAKAIEFYKEVFGASELFRMKIQMA